MKKVAQNLHAVFSVTQPIDLIDYFSQVTTEWEQAPRAVSPLLHRLDVGGDRQNRIFTLEGMTLSACHPVP